MHKFDTQVQELKYKVLYEIAKASFKDTLLDEYYNIPKRIVPGPKPTMRCCIYKERAIVEERMKLALGGNKNIDNVVEVIKIACDECPLGGYTVTDRCRGCIAQRCIHACFKKAITFDLKTRSAVIDKEKCVNCGMCAKACQYSAIQNVQRPCEQACKVKAISMDEDYACKIDDSKCIQCGACVYQCPFGAIMDKSSITDVIKLIKDSHWGKKYPLIAIVAPSIATQFKPIELGKIVSAIKLVGFTSVVEAALGADIVSYNEAKELAEKGLLTSSCCPTFVTYIKKNYPHLFEHVSTNLSPMASIARHIKENHPESHIVFVGPCVSKKQEVKLEEVKKYVDYTLTFEELNALIDAQEIDVEKIESSELDNASYYGRIFARAGGLTEAVKEALKEQNSDFALKPMQCDGLDNIRMALNKIGTPSCDFNFLEGMACQFGCINGPCSLSHELRDKMEIDKHGKTSSVSEIKEALDRLEK